MTRRGTAPTDGNDGSDPDGDARDTGANGSERDANADNAGVPAGDLTFSAAGVREGYRKCVPIALGVAGYGVVFGVLARRAGLSVAEATLMSATVLAGAAQVVAVELWAESIPVVALVVTTFVVNLRYALMGASLRPWFRHLSPRRTYGSLFFMADENWALTMAELRSGGTRGAFLLGSGLAIWSFWVAATVVGATVGGVVADPARWGFDFVLTAVFLVLAVTLWEGKRSLAPWTAAAGVALAGAQWLPGEWYILLGGLAASATAVVRRG